jgi:rhamnose transport system permease protein
MTTIAPPPATPAGHRPLHLLGRYKRELSVGAAYLLLLVGLALAAPAFFSRGELRGSWIRSAPVLVVAVGMTLVILTRHIDISVGSQFSVCGVVAGLMAREGVPMPLVVVLTLATGAAMGMANGALVALLGLPSIVVTLATMVVLREALRWAREGEAVRNLPADFQWLGLPQQAGEWMLVLAALAVFAAAAWATRWLAAGRAVYAVGSDAEAARLAGVRPRRVVFSAFALLGVLTALAALLNAIRFPQVDVNAGVGLELQVIAAAVVGGAAVSGGRGTMTGTLLGALLLVAIGPALVFLGVSAYWERAIQGLIILVAVASDGLVGRRSGH